MILCILLSITKKRTTTIVALQRSDRTDLIVLYMTYAGLTDLAMVMLMFMMSLSEQLMIASHCGDDPWRLVMVTKHFCHMTE